MRTRMSAALTDSCTPIISPNTCRWCSAIRRVRRSATSCFCSWDSCCSLAAECASCDACGRPISPPPPLPLPAPVPTRVVPKHVLLLRTLLKRTNVRVVKVVVLGAEAEPVLALRAAQLTRSGSRAGRWPPRPSARANRFCGWRCSSSSTGSQSFHSVLRLRLRLTTLPLASRSRLFSAKTRQ